MRGVAKATSGSTRHQRAAACGRVPLNKPVAVFATVRFGAGPGRRLAGLRTLHKPHAPPPPHPLQARRRRFSTVKDTR